MSSQEFQDDDYTTGTLDLALWRRIIGHARPYRRELAGLGLSGLVIAIIDVGFPLATKLLIDEAQAAGFTSRLTAYGIGYLSFIFVFALCVWWFIVLAGRAATGVGHDLRRGAFARLQELQFGYFDVRSVGWLVSRLTADCTKVSSLLPWLMLDAVWGSCLIVGIAVVMLLLSWKLALVVMIIVPPLSIATVYFQSRLLESSRQVRRCNSIITASFTECIMGVRTTKTLVRERENLGEFEEQTVEMFSHSMRNSLQSAVYLPMVIVLGSAGVGLALWRGGIDVMSTGVTLGTLVAFMQYAALLHMPIQELARRFTELQGAQAAAERVQSLLDTAPEIADSEEVRRAEAAGAIPDDGAIDTIEFREVGFEYKTGEPVLEAFDLTVRAGQTIALVGATGGGKSTIVSLAARFYEPTSGSVLVNGIDYRQRPLHWLQSRLGVVLQTPHLFAGTIRENIRYGRLDATDAEVEDAAVLVNAHEFITETGDGYETEVGEGGAKLSTGQRQLVALARALLADPQIFILDEATSSVDTETERLIQGAIERVLAGRIAFVIAHRLSTIRSADRILVIDGGHIVEQGRHEELLEARGRYHALYTRHSSFEQTERVIEGAVNGG
ncbi:MAG: ABC transporter ATP-binding protein [Planctomycetes bacterium]|nr:ABC transporter ATP-binding protein [Planctomycetota bacterium]